MASVVDFQITNFQNIHIMIENELRLGNLLFDEKSNQIFEVQFSDLIAMQKGGIDYYSRVAITEKLLLNSQILKSKDCFFFEFTKKGSGDVITIFIKNENGYWFYGVENSILDSVSINKIDFIDEIQNIVFFLSGEELVFSSTEP